MRMSRHTIMRMSPGQNLNKEAVHCLLCATSDVENGLESFEEHTTHQSALGVGAEVVEGTKLQVGNMSRRRVVTRELGSGS